LLQKVEFSFIFEKISKSKHGLMRLSGATGSVGFLTMRNEHPAPKLGVWGAKTGVGLGEIRLRRAKRKCMHARSWRASWF
jgi:hypothetical protein